MTNAQQQVRVLFVCMGNICRSPTAQGVFTELVEQAGLTAQITTDSAGTHAYHIGKTPDPRAQEAAAKRGIDLSSQRARQVTWQDCGAFDYLIAMDHNNFSLLQQACPSEYRDRLHLMMAFAPDLAETEVPDPYFGGRGGFERVLDMLETAAQGLLDHICAQHRL